MTDQLTALLDSADITRTMYDYATGLDSKNWELWRSIFTDEISTRFGAAPGANITGLGQDWATMSADEWVEGRRILFTGLAATQHQMSNPVVAIEGDRATCTMSLQAIHFLPDAPTEDYTVGGSYVDDLVRTADGWKITRVDLRVTWERGDATLLERGRELGRRILAAAT